MLYHINNWLPTPGMSTSGFSVELFPLWKTEFEKSKMTQKQVDNVLGHYSELWLSTHGFDPKIHERGIRVTVGEWGLEHISVPGNACGLDIGIGSMGEPHNGKVLIPHNVDSLKQASLLLTVFLWFANTIVLNIKIEGFNKKES